MAEIEPYHLAPARDLGLKLRLRGCDFRVIHEVFSIKMMEVQLTVT
jgi:hypothetical protein